MADTSGIIDTSGDTPRIRAGALAALLSGSILWGWYVGFLDFLTASLGGVTSTWSGLGAFQGDLFGAIIGLAVAGMNAAAASNAEFLSGLGVFGVVVGVIEVVALTVGVLWVLSTAASRITGAI